MQFAAHGEGQRGGSRAGERGRAERQETERRSRPRRARRDRGSPRGSQDGVDQRTISERTQARARGKNGAKLGCSAERAQRLESQESELGRRQGEERGGRDEHQRSGGRELRCADPAECQRGRMQGAHQREPGADPEAAERDKDRDGAEQDEQAEVPLEIEQGRPRARGRLARRRQIE